MFSTRFYVATSVTVMLFVLLESYYLLAVALLNCFFVPQILKNILDNQKLSLKPSVFLSIAAGRLALVVYFFGYPGNFLVWRPKYWFEATVAALFCLQVAFLTLQKCCGPRFFLPQRYKPKPYSYYQAFPEELEMTEQVECNICLNLIDKDDRLVMTTPCSHLFHQDCLTQWMEIKLQCPTCRRELPVLEE
jgi:hypothetical protein